LSSFYSHNFFEIDIEVKFLIKTLEVIMKKITFTLVFIFTTFLFAQNPEWIIYNTSNSGLPDNFVLAIAIANSGNKWIGTKGGGLAKFDGISWTVYNTSNSGLPSNWVKAIAIDNAGNIWIGTWGGGLAKFDGRSWTVYNKSNSSLPNDYVNAIAIDNEDNKWIGTVPYWDGQQWVGGGLAKFDGVDWTVYNTSNSGLPSDFVWAIAIDNAGNKWIGTYYGGLAKFDGVNWTVYNALNSGLPDYYVIAIAIDNAGNKWIGTLYGGLAKFDGVDWTVYNISNSGLPSNWVRAIAIDNAGNKWIGTDGGGLAKFDGISWSVYNTSNSGLPNDYVNAIAIDNAGHKWIGTYKGLTVIQGDEKQTFNLALLFNRDNNLWLMDINGKNQRQITRNSNIWSAKISKKRDRIAFYSDNYLYIISSNGEILDKIELDKDPYGGTFDAKMSPDGSKVALVKVVERLNEIEARQFDNEYIKKGSPKTTEIYIYDLTTKKFKKIVSKLPNNLKPKEHRNENKWIDWWLHWSPTSDKLYFTREYDIYAEKDTYGDSYLYDVNNGQLKYLGTSPGTILNWLNNKIVCSPELITSIYDISNDELKESKVFSKFYDEYYQNIEYLAGSNDKWLFVSSLDTGNLILLYDTKTDKIKILTKAKETIKKACFSPDGHKILYLDNNGLKILEIDNSGNILSTSNLRVNNFNSINDIFWIMDDVIIFNFNITDKESVWTINPNGSNLKKIADDAKFIDWVRVPKKLLINKSKN
jgi:sugar lactone lactonase YvrE